MMTLSDANVRVQLKDNAGAGFVRAHNAFSLNLRFDPRRETRGGFSLVKNGFKTERVKAPLIVAV